jgi:triosephosphate isomerase
MSRMMKDSIQKKTIVGNWKMHTTSCDAKQLAKGIVDGLRNEEGVSIISRVSIAYEPVWAIGNADHHATPQQVEDAHAILRARFGQIFGKDAAAMVSIQYGGSVVPDDASALFSRPGVDGALIGGASLIANEFLAIARSAVAETQALSH